MSSFISEYGTRQLPYFDDVSHQFEAFSDCDGAVWLDSCAPHTSGRYDIISAKPYQTLVYQDNKTILIKDSRKEEFDEDPLVLLEKLLSDLCHTTSDLPFTHGPIGYVGYEYGLGVQDLIERDKPGLAIPDIYFGFYDWVIVVDHQKQCTTLGYLVKQKSEVELNQIISLWKREEISSGPFKLTSPFLAQIDKFTYGDAFDRIKTHLEKGESYQVNLSQRFSADFEGDPYRAYCALRKINPMPYAAFMRVNHEAVLSFSPELFFSAHRETVVTQPIKGTIRREQDEEEDEKVKVKLQRSEKDRAENTMIVDLLRNDLSKVCKPYTVTVDKVCELESFSSVHHLVSTITGELKHDNTHIDLFRALFPCGSITGAPKHETMKIISSLENHKRNVYCGSMGYFSRHHRSQFNVAIRTMMTYRGSVHCSGGGGIVLDSEKEKEYQETIDKINILTETLGRCDHDEILNIRTV